MPDTTRSKQTRDELVTVLTVVAKRQTQVRGRHFEPLERALEIERDKLISAASEVAQMSRNTSEGDAPVVLVAWLFSLSRAAY
jgi:hypothetical protein